MTARRRGAIWLAQWAAQASSGVPATAPTTLAPTFGIAVSNASRTYHCGGALDPFTGQPSTTSSSRSASSKAETAGAVTLEAATGVIEMRETRLRSPSALGPALAALERGFKSPALLAQARKQPTPSLSHLSLGCPRRTVGSPARPPLHPVSLPSSTRLSVETLRRSSRSTSGRRSLRALLASPPQALLRASSPPRTPASLRPRRRPSWPSASNASGPRRPRASRTRRRPLGPRARGGQTGCGS